MTYLCKIKKDFGNLAGRIISNQMVPTKIMMEKRITGVTKDLGTEKAMIRKRLASLEI